MRRGAVISENGMYRYKLWRIWDELLPLLGWIMLNPSVADGNQDDATIRLCMGRAKREGFGGIGVCNLYAYRTTFPAELWAARRNGVDIVGPHNDQSIADLIVACPVVVAAWGSGGGIQTYYRVLDVIENLKGHDVRCLGLTKSGFPRHPLRVSYSQPLEAYLWSAN